MGCRIGDVVWLRRDSRLIGLRGRVGTNLGKVGEVWVGRGRGAHQRRLRGRAGDGA
jgi:hypothetical protein